MKARTRPRAIGNSRRRVYSSALSVVFFVICFSAEAQQPKKIPRIGILNPGSPVGYTSDWYDSFRQGLRELGYIEGKNIVIEARYAEGKRDRLFDLATQLTESKVDVIVTVTTPGILAAKKATSTVPIIFAAAGDPVRAGLVTSLARPGGNITGLSMLAPEVGGKRLELLKETIPKINIVAYIRNPTGGAEVEGRLEEIKTDAHTLGLRIQFLEVRSVEDFDKAFEAILRGRAEALTVQSLPIININHKRIVEFAAKNRLPAIYPLREFVDSGGLMFYGVNFTDLYRRAAIYVDKIFKGAKPAELPIEQPKRFEFIVNLNTAKQIGLTIPPNVLARADKVIR